ncbi:MAG: hypothetical protein R3B07_07780 [Polyangiaceae bacterium]
MISEDCQTDLALMCSALRRLFGDHPSDVICFTEEGVSLQLSLVSVGVVQVTFQAGESLQRVSVDFAGSSMWLDSDPAGSLLRTDLSASLGAASGAALCELVHHHVQRLAPVAASLAVRGTLRGASGTRPRVPSGSAEPRAVASHSSRDKG